ncbi:MAG: FosX/FosE/FosI family fosfomycin resistance hydrolase [Pseudomonadota bacterium]
MTEGLSHITLICADLDRTGKLLENVLGARLLYASGTREFSKSAERFYDVGGTWVAIMEGPALDTRSYNHVAFKVEDHRLDACEATVRALGLEVLQPRPRVEGEGRSLYFYDADNHLFELHTGTLEERLRRYALEDAE